MIRVRPDRVAELVSRFSNGGCTDGACLRSGGRQVRRRSAAVLHRVGESFTPGAMRACPDCWAR